MRYGRCQELTDILGKFHEPARDLGAHAVRGARPSPSACCGALKGTTVTTNVYDRSSSTIASDSRWSIEIAGKCLIYVDDSGYEKVDVVGEHAFLFAGDVNLIHQWKVYLRLRSQGQGQSRPQLQGIAFLAVKLGTCEIIGGYGQDIVPQEDGQIIASFAGTGSFHAH